MPLLAGRLILAACIAGLTATLAFGLVRHTNGDLQENSPTDIGCCVTVCKHKNGVTSSKQKEDDRRRDACYAASRQQQRDGICSVDFYRGKACRDVE